MSVENIIYTEVDKSNFKQIIKLKVKTDQMKYVSDNAVSLAQTYILESPCARTLLVDNAPVGLVTFAKYKDGYKIYKFMIDTNYQGKGYGKQLLTFAMNEISLLSNNGPIYLSVHYENKDAIGLYEKMGFKEHELFKAGMFMKK